MVRRKLHILTAPRLVHLHEPNTSGPPEADRIVVRLGGWPRPAPLKEVAR
jgi:hypothetical protein